MSDEATGRLGDVYLELKATFGAAVVAAFLEDFEALLDTTTLASLASASFRIANEYALRDPDAPLAVCWARFYNQFAEEVVAAEFVAAVESFVAESP